MTGKESLSSLERWTGLYDTPTRQLLFYIVLEAEGTPDPARFADAVADTAHRLEWFRNYIGEDGYWHPGTFSAGEAIEHADATGFIGSSIDKSHPPLFRILVEDGRIIFKFNHVLTDALGALRFVKSIINAYNGEEAREGLPRAADDGEPVRGGSALKAAAGWLKNMAVPATQVSCLRGAGFGSAGFVYTTLGAEYASGLKSYARSLGVTVNDVLTAVLFVTIAQWNRQRGETGRNYRFSLPVQTVSGEVSYRNSFDMAVLDFGRDMESRDMDEVVSYVSGSMSSRKGRRGKGEIFGMLELLPRKAGRMLIGSRIFTTTTAFSNIGIMSDGPLRLGDREITGAHFLVGIHPPRNICFSSMGYAGKISLSVSYDDGCWDEGLLDGFLEVLRANAAKVTGAESLDMPLTWLPGAAGVRVKG